MNTNQNQPASSHQPASQQQAPSAANQGIELRDGRNLPHKLTDACFGDGLRAIGAVARRAQSYGKEALTCVWKNVIEPHPMLTTAGTVGTLAGGVGLYTLGPAGLLSAGATAATLGGYAVLSIAGMTAVIKAGKALGATKEWLSKSWQEVREDLKALRGASGKALDAFWTECTNRQDKKCENRITHKDACGVKQVTRELELIRNNPKNKNSDFAQSAINLVLERTPEIFKSATAAHVSAAHQAKSNGISAKEIRKQQQEHIKGLVRELAEDILVRHGDQEPETALASIRADLGTLESKIEGFQIKKPGASHIEVATDSATDSTTPDLSTESPSAAAEATQEDAVSTGSSDTITTDTNPEESPLDDQIDSIEVATDNATNSTTPDVSTESPSAAAEATQEDAVSTSSSDTTTTDTNPEESTLDDRIEFIDGTDTQIEFIDKAGTPEADSAANSAENIAPSEEHAAPALESPELQTIFGATYIDEELRKKLSDPSASHEQLTALLTNELSGTPVSYDPEKKTALSQAIKAVSIPANREIPHYNDLARELRDQFPAHVKIGKDAGGSIVITVGEQTITLTNRHPALGGKVNISYNGDLQGGMWNDKVADVVTYFIEKGKPPALKNEPIRERVIAKTLSSEEKAKLIYNQFQSSEEYSITSERPFFKISDGENSVYVAIGKKQDARYWNIYTEKDGKAVNDSPISVNDMQAEVERHLQERKQARKKVAEEEATQSATPVQEEKKQI